MTDPVDLAREALDTTEYLDAIPSVAPVARTQVMISLAEAAPDLAHAVIDLTARLDAERFAHANTAVKVKRVEELVDRLSDGRLRYLIRAALNGETND